jgi:hypothetical protein
MGISGPNQAAGGFTLAPGGTPPNYPRGWVPRYIYGVQNAADESTHKLECPSNSATIFTTATTFIIAYNAGTQTFVVHGKFAEKRKVKY